MAMCSLCSMLNSQTKQSSHQVTFSQREVIHVYHPLQHLRRDFSCVLHMTGSLLYNCKGFED